ncbi:MAG: opacity family porin [Gallionella sp.]
MKRVAIAALLSIFVAAPAVAAEGKASVGVNYGLDLDGVFGIQGEFDISSMTNKAPVSVQVFWKNYSQSYTIPGWGTYKWSYNGFGAAAIYDFSSVAKLDKKIKPYAGLGVIALNSSLSGPAGGFGVPGADSGGLYITFGARYSLTPQVAADLNYNNFGGLTIGANFSF